MSTTEARPVGRPRAYTRDQVVDAALLLAGEGGYAAVSMRNLAASLEVRPATLYAYVADKEELVGAMVERILDGVDLEGRGSWRTQLTSVLRSYYLVLLHYPGLINQTTSLTSASPAAEAIAERCLALLGDGGFAGRDATLRLSALMSYVFGSATSRAWAERTPVRPPLASSSPLLREALTHSDDAVFAESFEIGLKLLLTKQPPGLKG